MSFVPTVRIKVQPCKGNEEGIVVMNEADYDPAKHELYDPAKEAALKAEADAAAKKAEEEKAEKERLEKEQAQKDKAQKDEKAEAKDEQKRGKK